MVLKLVFKIEKAKGSDGTTNYQHLEKPTVMRKHVKPATMHHHTPAPAPKAPVVDIAQELDYLDIPAFLRRKEEVL